MRLRLQEVGGVDLGKLPTYSTNIPLHERKATANQQKVGRCSIAGGSYGLWLRVGFMV